MASSESDSNTDLNRQRPRADGFGSAWEPLNPPVITPPPKTQTEDLSISSGENILLASASTGVHSKSILRPAPCLASRSDTFVDATPSGEVQMRRNRIFGETGVRANLTNQNQSDCTSSEVIRGTQVPKGGMTSSQVPVTNSDYMAGRSDDGGRTAPHVSMYSGFEHDSSTGVGVDNGQSVSSFRGRVLRSESTSQRPSTWGHLGGRNSPLDGWNSYGNQGVDTVQTTGLAQPREGVARGIGARYSQTNYNLGFSHDFSNNNDRDNGYGVAIPDDRTPGGAFRRDIYTGWNRPDMMHVPQEGQGYEPKHKDRKPAPYDGKSEWRNYIVQFEMIAEINKWDPLTKALELAICLRGAAAGVLSELGPELRRDYNAMVAALERQFGPGDDVRLFKAKLRNRVRGKGESLPALLQDIKRLVSLAYPGVDGATRDSLTLDQFVLALNHQEMQWNVIDSDIRTAEEALQKCQKYEAFHNITQGGQMNVRGNLRVTSESELALYRHEEILGRLAKMENKNPQGPNSLMQGPGDVKENRTCFYCKTRGHIQRNCVQFADDVRRGVISKNDWRVKKYKPWGVSQGNAEANQNGSLN